MISHIKMFAENASQVNTGIFFFMLFDTFHVSYHGHHYFRNHKVTKEKVYKGNMMEKSIFTFNLHINVIYI